MKIMFLDLYKQYLSIKKEIDDAISSVISESAFVGGKYVKQFEENFSIYQQVEYCIGVANGTDALEISIEALDLPEGSEIIVPANSFIASAEAVSRAGHKVVFCDVNVDDFTINPESVKQRITDNTSAIMAVHLYGHPCDMDPLLELAKKYNLRIIEDCAQAHGAEYKGKRVGGLGNIGCFSFYPGKNLGAYGDGGAIVTSDEVLAMKCRMIANHGRLFKYEHEFEGRNSRLDGIQAAILIVKLKYLDKWTDHRIDIASAYVDCLSNIEDIILPSKKQWVRHVFHLFVIRSKQRDIVKEALLKNNIQSGIHYPVALPKLRAYKHLGYANDEGYAWKMDKELLSIPIGEHISVDDVIRVKEAIKSINTKKINENFTYN